MKNLKRFFAVIACALCALYANAQSGGTDTVVVQRSPAKATGYVPTVQSDGKIHWGPPSGGTWSSITGKPTTLSGFGITDAQPFDSDLDAIALLSTTSFGRSLLASADAAAWRTLAGLVIGTNVQAYDSDLTGWAALAPSAKQDALGYSPARAQTVAALGSNALSLNPTSTSNAISTATWTGTPVTLTYTGGSDTAGEQQRLLVNVTSTTQLTVTPTSSTVYRNGATTALGASPVSFSPGRYWITFVTPDTGTNLYMEDTAVAASDLALLDAGTYFTTDNVEAALQELAASRAAARSVETGGTGSTSLTAYAPIFGGTTSTSPLQSGTVGTAGHVLTSNGAGAIPTFQAVSGGGGGALSVGSYYVWSTADIAGRPANSLVADGTNGTLNLGTVSTGGSWIVAGNGTVATPTVDIPAGTYSATQNITATSATSGATLRYTTTGVDPTTSDTTVSGTIPVSASGTLKIKAWKDLYAASAVFSGAYTINSNAYVTAVLADSPLAYWRLNEAAPSGAGSILDYSAGGTNDATPNGTITWAQPGALYDDSGDSGLLDGSTGYITGGASLATAMMADATWTVELWFYAGATNAGRVFAAASDSTHEVCIEHYNSVLYSSSDAGGNRSSANLTETWHHIVLNSSGNMWIDGVAAAGTSSTATSSNNQLTVGARNNITGYFNGKIAEVSIYGTALNGTQVAAHFDAAMAGAVPSGQNFGMTMASATPEIFPAGGDITGTLFGGAALVDDGGVNVLEVGGAAWRSLTFDNPTLYQRWANITEGTYELEFKYSGTLAKWMLTQFTGKDTSGLEDTNDYIKLSATTTGAELVYGFNDGVSSRTLNVATTLTAGTWYTARVKWRTSSAPYISVTVNGVETTSSVSGEVGTVANTAFHQILIGNDTSANPTSLKIRNFKVYGSWQP